MNIRALLPLALVLAAPLPTTWAEPASAHFVAEDSADLMRAVPPPPGRGSLAELVDLETLLRVQAARTPADVAWAKTAANVGAQLLEGQFPKAEYPKTAKLLAEVYQDADAATDRIKSIYKRRRPPLIDSEIHPCVRLPHSFSYPSGHSSSSFVVAAVLGDIVPAQRAEFLELAHRIAWGRIIGGVHYPSDDVAGRVLAEAFVAQLRQNPDFQAEVAAARAEVAAEAPASAVPAPAGA